MTTIDVQNLIDRLDDGETVMDAVDDASAALEDLRSYVVYLQDALKDMLLLIEEHGSPVMKAHASRTLRASKILHAHTVK